jgi:hypothetical protein
MRLFFSVFDTLKRPFDENNRELKKIRTVDWRVAVLWLVVTEDGGSSTQTSLHY